MLAFIKNALGITSNLFDTELTAYIASAKKDLGFGNVDTISENDDLTKSAITTYCVYMFELLHGDSAKASRLFDAYNNIKMQMGFSSSYNTRS